MKLELSHIAIACPAIQQLADKLKALALEIEVTHDVPSEKVKAAMLPVNVSEHFRLELLEPTDPNSPISKFLSKRPDGGIHHVSFEVSQIEQWQTLLLNSGFEILPPGIRKGARGKALFIHPKSMGGVLVELEEMTT
ncbi:MAG: methylmalonyl-CoA epimerase [Proteobacteria bacterium]|jgi:methylmalonyl-CoA/ethylmalonyl-CoA epimerase|nr:methylmalonyl-CoA epimerase [Pseudomonadota bacterium]